MESSQSTEKKTVHNAQSYQHENPSEMVPSRPSFPSSPHLDTKLKGVLGLLALSIFKENALSQALQFSSDF